MTLARPHLQSSQGGPWMPPRAMPAAAQPSPCVGSRDSIDPLPEHLWEKVIALLTARDQAVAACTHPLWRRVCGDPRLEMHRAHLDHALEICPDAGAMVAVFEKHRHVLPHLDTLVLQPKLVRRLQAASDIDEIVAVRRAAPEPEALFPALDWLGEASARAFTILTVCDSSCLCVALTNGKHSRHPMLTDMYEAAVQGIAYPQTTAEWLAVMPKVAHLSDAITHADVTSMSLSLASQQAFWHQFVQYYPQTRWLSIKREQFEEGFKFVDALCGLQHLQRLSVEGLTPEALSPGLKARHAAGAIALVDVVGY